MTKMRVKMVVESVMRVHGGASHLDLRAVTIGSAEDNTYSKDTPSAYLCMTVTNEALYGQFNPGDTFYVDFIPADTQPAST